MHVIRSNGALVIPIGKHGREPATPNDKMSRIRLMLLVLDLFWFLVLMVLVYTGACFTDMSTMINKFHFYKSFSRGGASVVIWGMWRFIIKSAWRFFHCRN